MPRQVANAAPAPTLQHQIGCKGERVLQPCRVLPEFGNSTNIFKNQLRFTLTEVDAACGKIGVRLTRPTAQHPRAASPQTSLPDAVSAQLSIMPKDDISCEFYTWPQPRPLLCFVTRQHAESKMFEQRSRNNNNFVSHNLHLATFRGILKSECHHWSESSEFRRHVCVYFA